jgi:hypothetical protein
MPEEWGIRELIACLRDGVLGFTLPGEKTYENFFFGDFEILETCLV